MIDRKNNIIGNSSTLLIILNASIFFCYTILFSLEIDYYFFKQVLLISFFLTYLLTCNEININYNLLFYSFLIVLFSYIFNENVDNNYHLIPILYLAFFIFSNKDISFYLKYFFLSLNFFVIFFSVLILFDLDNFLNLQKVGFIIIGLPGLFYIKNKFFFYLNLSILSAISFIFLERQIFIILFIILILYLINNKNEKNIYKLFFFIIIVNLVLLIFFIKSEDSVFLNDLFNKRPIIFNYYYQIILNSNIMNIIFGHGFLDFRSEFFFNMSEYFDWLRLRFRNFSPHNFFIFSIYTYGLFGLLVILFFINKLFLINFKFVEKKIMLTFLIVGTLQSFNFLAHQPVSIMFSLLIISILRKKIKRSYD